ncbi:MAG: NAD-dependent malic enzyme, partial [Tetrasphaera sp.]|nr:NAD-dependent malic enzyme [Tetrasphaera sp.]
VVGKDISRIRIAVSGVGAAGHAIIELLLAQGATDIVACGRAGAIHAGQSYDDPDRQWIAQHTNRSHEEGSLRDVLKGSDVFIGVSAPNLLTGDDIATMADDAIVFALANPDPEVDPLAAGEHAAVVATGRSDYPNQINNVLCFPGFFRGMLDAGAKDITQEVMVAAATAIANSVTGEELNASYIVPSVFDPVVAPAVAHAVRAAIEPLAPHEAQVTPVGKVL